MKQVRFKHNNEWYRLTVDYDPDPLHPRRDQNHKLTTILLWQDLPHLLDNGHDTIYDFDGIPHKAALALRRTPLAYHLPIYYYQHSGETVSTTPTTPTGVQVGIVGIKSWDGVLDCEDAKSIIKGEVNQLDQHLKGLSFEMVLDKFNNETGGYEYEEHILLGSYDSIEEVFEFALEELDNDLCRAAKDCIKRSEGV